MALWSWSPKEEDSLDSQYWLVLVVGRRKGQAAGWEQTSLHPGDPKILSLNTAL